MKIKSIGIVAGSLLTLLIGGALFVTAQQTINKPEPFKFTQQAAPQESKRQPIQVQQSFQGKIQEAKDLIQNQYYQEATLLLSSAISTKPNLLEPYLLLGQVYTETQDEEKLKNIIEVLQRKFPNDLSIPILETKRLIMLGEFQTILNSFENQENLAPELAFYEATLLALQNNHEAAKEIYSEILDLDVEEQTEDIIAEEVLENTEQEGDAISNEDTLAPEPITEISQSLQDKTQALIDTYEAFDLVNDGENPHLFALFSKSLAQSRELHLAKAFAEEALKEDVKYIDAWVLRGYASLLLGQTDSALKDLEYAYEQSPERTQTHYFLGLAYAEIGKNKEAAQFFERVLETDYEFEDNLKEKLIDIYLEQKEYEKVIGLYGELLLENKNPKDHIPPLQMAIEVINKPEIALEFTKKLISQNPNDYLSYNFHAWALIANKRFTEAKESLNTSLELSQNNPGAYLYLGLLNEEQGKIPEALEAYKKSYDFGSQGPEIGITRLAAEKHNQLLEQKDKPETPIAPDRAPSSP